MNTPVAFFIYRRPDLTARVFARIRAARPPMLLVVADGPQSEADASLCAATRAVIDGVDWPCDVRRHFHDVNQGCRRCVSSGLDWVFATVPEAIVLEDDCLPDPTFFPFCEALLERYRSDERIGHISGDDFSAGVSGSPDSYMFSRYASVWGWASWRRAWRAYDASLRHWPEIKRSGRHRTLFARPDEVRHFESVCDAVYAGQIDTWDVQWQLAMGLAGQLAIAPNGNLVVNVGFRQDASRTSDLEHPFASLTARPMVFPLRHPPEIRCDDRADRHRAEVEFLHRPSLAARLGRTVLNKHRYGAGLRRIPGVGAAWARYRRRRQAGRGGRDGA